ncbi:glutathione S-transferase family protein [Sedimentitalea sp. XS_ASV28]|uniref:glutathione S-transferase family protein n=1 Tax=Sedimentitalea sp. XS_ASV28 TaxID=3241296 RepID=UPI003514A15A
MGLILYAYPPSVYCQIVRMALHHLELTAQMIEVDPFTGIGDNPHPFGLVPTLRDDEFELWETCAILRYLDAQYAGGRLSPASPRTVARMVQVQSIADSQAYWPLVRMVFAQRVFAPLHGEAPDETRIAEGMTRAAPVLGALDDIAREGLVLAPGNVSLADIHLAPILGFFNAAPEGAAALNRYPALHRWFGEIGANPAYRETCPPLTHAKS